MGEIIKRTEFCHAQKKKQKPLKSDFLGLFSRLIYINRESFDTMCIEGGFYRFLFVLLTCVACIQGSSLFEENVFEAEAEYLCNTHTDCSDCTKESGCNWCHVNTDLSAHGLANGTWGCVSLSSSLGNCSETISVELECPNDKCSLLGNCTECLFGGEPRCRWCTDLSSSVVTGSCSDYRTVYTQNQCSASDLKYKFATRCPSIPPAVSGVVANPSSGGSLHVKWNPPFDVDFTEDYLPLSGYTLIATQTDQILLSASSNTSTVNIDIASISDPRSPSWTMSFLQGQKRYGVGVTANNRVGSSASSTPSYAITNPLEEEDDPFNYTIAVVIGIVVGALLCFVLVLLVLIHLVRKKAKAFQPVESLAKVTADVYTDPEMAAVSANTNDDFGKSSSESGEEISSSAGANSAAADGGGGIGADPSTAATGAQGDVDMNSNSVDSNGGFEEEMEVVHHQPVAVGSGSMEMRATVNVQPYDPQHVGRVSRGRSRSQSSGSGSLSASSRSFSRSSSNSSDYS